MQALHKKGIVHRDLKPQNVLLTPDGQAKVADMGLSKTLPTHVSSFDSLGGSGSSGWQAPEQIHVLPPAGAACDSGSRGGCAAAAAAAPAADDSSGGEPALPSRQSKATDIFSLGLVLFWTLTRCGHPFGADRFERDGNILRNEPDLSAVAHNPELENLLRAMLHRCAPLSTLSTPPPHLPPLNPHAADGTRLCPTHRSDCASDTCHPTERPPNTLHSLLPSRSVISSTLPACPPIPMHSVSRRGACMPRGSRRALGDQRICNHASQTVHPPARSCRELPTPHQHRPLATPHPRCRDPKMRPDTAAVLAHPAWWTAQRKLAFLLDVSDRFELADRAADANATLAALEGTAPSAFPPGSNWASALEQQLLDNLYQYRRYKSHSVRDLLRVIRNKANHFRELPPAIQALIGQPPSGYFAYFSSRFPRLLLTMLFFVSARGGLAEPGFLKYEITEADCGKFATVHALAPAPAAAAPAAAAPATTGPAEAAAPAPDRTSQSAPELAGSSGGAPRAPAPHMRHLSSPPQYGSGMMRPQMSPPLPPPPPAPPSHPMHALSGAGVMMPPCASPGQPHAPWPPSNPPRPPPPPPHAMPVGYKDSGSRACTLQSFPQNPGAQLCEFYVRTGNCKFGDACFKDHPPLYQVPLNMMGLPMRRGALPCVYYMQTGTCEFGPACKFHHPNLEPVYPTSTPPPQPPHAPPAAAFH